MRDELRKRSLRAAEASLEPLWPPDTKPHVLFFILASLLSFKKITEVIAALTR